MGGGFFWVCGGVRIKGAVIYKRDVRSIMISNTCTGL